MKKLPVLFVSIFIFFRCQKEIIMQKEISNVLESKIISPKVPIKSSIINPFDFVGQNLFSLLEYLETFSSEIGDPTIFCPIEYSATQVKVFTTKTKMLNQIKEFSIINNLPLLSDQTLSDIYDSRDGADPIQKLDLLVSNGEISLNLKNILIDMNNTF